jgi:hypothetical protein
VPAVRRLTFVLIVGLCGSLSAATASSSASGVGLHILVTGNCFTDAPVPLAAAIQKLPGVAKATAVDTTITTPSAATLKQQDLVVSLGDTCGGYQDAATWGNELADYADHGGAVLQAAYDNWDDGGPEDASPTGRFASGGYAPFELGPNDNLSTTLGELEVPTSPILKGLGTFANDDNTTDALAPGATLLAKWADGRNAIAIKGRVVATTASGDLTDVNTDDAVLARLAVNTARFLGAPDTKITKATISSSKHAATFKFKAVGTAKGFQCELKHGKKASFKSCHSPKTYKHLKPGKYTFEVRAVGSGGPDKTPAKKSFKIGS